MRLPSPSLSRCLALVSLLCVLPAVGIATSPDDPPATPADSAGTPADPYEGYLDFLSRFGERRFSAASLDGVSLADSVVDRLVSAYDSTGVAPVEPTPPRPLRFQVEPGLAGLRYNRVEGVSLRASLAMRPPVRHRLEIGGWVGYETAPEEIDWEGGIRTGRIRPLGGVRLRALHTRQVVAYGSGGIVGNTWTALIAGDDFDDYFRRKGWELGIERRFRRLGVDLSYRIEDQESIEAATDFSVFGGKDPFRPNPPIDDGEARILRLAVEQARSEAVPVSTRWEAALAGSGLGGDFDYRSGSADAVAVARPWRGDRAILRLAAGAVDGDSIAVQAAHHLGGFDTLRGYGVNEFAARRYVHAGFDYEIGTDLLRPIPLVRRLRVQFIPFFDTALFRPFRDTDESRARFSAGLGIQKNVFGIPGGVGQIRFDLGRRLDREQDAWTYRVRITSEASS